MTSILIVIKISLFKKKKILSFSQLFKFLMIHFSQYFKSSSNFKSFRNWSWNLHPLTHDPNNFIFNHLDFFVYYNPTLRIEFTIFQHLIVQYNFQFFSLTLPICRNSTSLVFKKTTSEIIQNHVIKVSPILPRFALFNLTCEKPSLLLFLSIGSLVDGHNPRLLYRGIIKRTAKRAREAARRVFFRVLDS